ncbi:T9SS type A sorting domain-containing protein [Flavobacterium luminosum]|uniref:T9SS type A sorting domain-containing protein n=1 Tax=Flavobacterium luminosum TaxID=2949086 RepID=A0ABT0TN50_9FLAO|nr:T9SS type A sorting domain-containing protein [Flavobacterium sp. HXWNR70]MCL9808923.1 T9SS type A sorting domain-containing protein [Flavobacterium sp. HXWNR70]
MNWNWVVNITGICNSGANTGFEGLIDELIFDKQVYTPAQIAQSYQEYLNTLSNEKFQDKTFNFYPNPVQNILNLEIEANIRVFDLSGRQIMKVDNANQIDVSSLAKGTYLLQLEIDGKVNNEKFIKM